MLLCNKRTLTNFFGQKRTLPFKNIKIVHLNQINAREKIPPCIFLESVKKQCVENVYDIFLLKTSLKTHALAQVY
jgi:hypothetical protein